MQRDGAVVVELVSFPIDLLGVGGDHVAGHLPDDLQDAAVVVDGVGGVSRRFGVCPPVAVGEVVLLDPGQLRQVEMPEKELDVFVIEKEVRHGTSAQGKNLRHACRCGSIDYTRFSSFTEAALLSYCRSRSDLIIIGITRFRSPTMP